MRGRRLSSFANSTLASSSPGPRSRVSRKENPGNFAPLSMARLWRDQGKREEARRASRSGLRLVHRRVCTPRPEGGEGAPGRAVAVSCLDSCCPQSQIPMRYACSHPDLFAVHDASDSRPFDHPVLKCCVVLELSHRELAAQTPRVEDETIGIEHGVAIGEPFAFR